MNTKTPSGLSIARNNMKFTFGWKIADKDHDGGQEIQWRTNKTGAGKWTALPLSNSATSKTVTLSATNFYPTTDDRLTTVSFRIRGKRAPYTEGSGAAQRTITPDWSEWARKDYTVKEPAAPSVSAELDSSLPNKTTFSWTAKNDAKNNQPFYNAKYWSCLIKECTETDGSKITFSGRTTTTTGTGNANGSVSIPEDTPMGEDSYTRWFKVRSQGARGYSAWKYAKHVYAFPKKPKINSISTIGYINQSAYEGETIINAKWTAPSDAAHPIDYTSLEYTVAIPDPGLKCPVNTTWNEALKWADTKKDDGARVVIPAAPSYNECMWVRVRCVHDEVGNFARDNSSDVKLVRVGQLTAPTLNGVSGPNASTRIATVSASNNSEVSDSRLAIIFRTDDGNADRIIGIIPHGQSSVDVKCPEYAEGTSISFGVFAFQGTSKGSTKDGVTTYSITANMRSDKVWQGGTVPLSPTNVTATVSADTVGEVIMEWDWNWAAANATELSWSQNPNAWESTDEPERYVITNLNQPHWRISGLETGVKWYFRARFAKTGGEDYVYGPYSDVVEVDLTSAPATPMLMLSKAVMAAGDTVTASWVYTTTDGTPQAYAEIAERTVNNNVETYTVIAHETTAQHVDITPDWATGTIHYLCVRVASASGHVSDGWSEPVGITIADPISCAISQTSITSLTITDSDNNSRTVNALRAMPLTVTVTGAGASGQTTVIIERAAEYRMARPDDTMTDGYDGETIAIIRQDGETQISIGNDDLVGLLDDGAQYRLIATTEDPFGQTASAELEFEVHWSHQAVIPTVTAVLTNGMARIRATTPSGYASGDVIDIYRLSCDKPEMIIQNGSYGTDYYDPYPTIGKHGGYRIVARTGNGDYITEDDTPAWTDLTCYIEEYSIIIDFDGRKAILPFDISLQNKWGKDFKVTNYLGGAQQGDWNDSIARTATYTTDLLADGDFDLINDLRALARYSGICHIRTPEGSSYAADIQVSESQNYSSHGVVSFTLTVTRVDPETLDGLTGSTGATG